VNAAGTINFPALQPGTYALFCPVGQHRANGMEVRITVAAAAPAAGLPATGGAAVPLGLAGAGLAGAAAGLVLRRRAA
jgi:LPXTG-motif cell wall-anchored protein